MPTPITKKGYEALKAELDRLRKVERPQVIEAIAEARAHGDLSENAEYDAAKERQGFIEARIAELLEFVGLAREANLQMHSFSTGMKQRAAIARGLLNEPDILFMDEPTRGLDPLAALELRNLVRNHVADGRRTVLLATNIMSEAEDLCHRIAFLSHGDAQHG